MSKRQKLQKNNLVAQGNELIEARHKLTKGEKLLLLAMISLINPNDTEFGFFSVTVDRLKEVLEINKTTVHKEFEAIVTRLMGRVVKIKTERGWKLRQWVSHADLEDNIITLRFHDDLKPYLLELKKRGHFTQFRLGLIIHFRSLYTLRIYQLLKEYQAKKIYEFEFSVQDFRDMMLGEGVTSYKAFNDFRKKILTVANHELSEINEKTGVYKYDLNFDIQTLRTGRKISHLIFTIKTQPTKPTPKIESKRPANDNAPQIILDYEVFGVMRKMVQPYLDQRGEQSLRNTLNKFHQDKATSKITKSEQGYLAYLLRVNAGQETAQDKERQLKEQDKQRRKEKEAQEQALKAAFIQERNAELKAFFDTLQKDEIEYMLPDFEASEIFKQHIKPLLVLHDLYQHSGLQDDDIKMYFNIFIVDRYLDKTLNNFEQWKEKKGQ